MEYDKVEHVHRFIVNTTGIHTDSMMIFSFGENAEIDTYFMI